MDKISVAVGLNEQGVRELGYFLVSNLKLTHLEALVGAYLADVEFVENGAGIELSALRARYDIPVTYRFDKSAVVTEEVIIDGDVDD